MRGYLNKYLTVGIYCLCKFSIYSKYCSASDCDKRKKEMNAHKNVVIYKKQDKLEKKHNRSSLWIKWNRLKKKKNKQKTSSHEILINEHKYIFSETITYKLNYFSIQETAWTSKSPGHELMFVFLAAKFKRTVGKDCFSIRF